jgi:hypothetical protein
VKLLGWIKSAVALIKTPASPREVGSQPGASPEIDSPAVPEDAGPDGVVEIPHESPIHVEPEIRISVESKGSPDQQEIDRRRAMVRKFFNDYWASIDDKPASFADRLDGAEGYINERVAAGGEAWQLDPATRKQLGLPPTKKKA